MKTVAIIHPWFPQYRKEFFEQLVSLAFENGVRLRIFHGTAPPEWDDRGDSISTEFATHLPTRFFKIGHKSLVYKSLRNFRNAGPFDLVILEQAIRNIETYVILFRRLFRNVAFWGHGRTYTQPSSQRQDSLKTWLTNKGVWFFAYTGGGARAVSQAGYDPARITIVNNSIDTGRLRLDVDCVTAYQIQAFKTKHDLKRCVALYIGGLDAAKRISFLLEAGRECHRLDPHFRLVIIGKGVENQKVIEASTREEWIIPLGPLFGPDKALAMAASDVLMIPGRVGLVAVESFAAGLPIITTEWPWHAPEFEYLQNGFNAVITPDDTAAYASQVVSLLSNTNLLTDMRESARKSMAPYSTESMVNNFWTGIERALGNQDRR